MIKDIVRKECNAPRPTPRLTKEKATPQPQRGDISNTGAIASDVERGRSVGKRKGLMWLVQEELVKRKFDGKRGRWGGELTVQRGRTCSGSPLNHGSGGKGMT